MLIAPNVLEYTPDSTRVPPSSLASPGLCSYNKRAHAHVKKSQAMFSAPCTA